MIGNNKGSSLTYFLLLLFVSWGVVAFGQPAWSPFLSIVAAFSGYACFWRLLVDLSNSKQRFFFGTLWFTSVQLVQLDWLLSHPYGYIYAVYFLLSLALGIQFGILCLCIKRSNLARYSSIFAIAALWTLLEWSRLFLLSGFSFNPVGLALTANLYSLQFASLLGVFGLSFWVILTNLLVLKSWVVSKKSFVFAALVAWLPYLYGVYHVQFHRAAMENDFKEMKVLLLHTSFPVEEAVTFSERRTTVSHVMHQWDQMLAEVKSHIDSSRSIKLIVFPEYVVLCGTYTPVFSFEEVKKIFVTHFGEESTKAFPPLNGYFTRRFHQGGKSELFVNNAFFAQALSNYCQAGVVIGMEDVEDTDLGRQHYSSAQFFKPNSIDLPERYDKRVLLPLGEYIPFAWCRSLAARYGVAGSFTPGKEAKVFEVAGVPFGVSICYEETYGDLMRESRLLGGEMLLNLTSDVWYPHSKLAQQHFDHARLRTVEGGVPLLRSSNVGITGAVDSLGQIIEIKEDRGDHGALLLDVPLYNYTTLYSRYGDKLILTLCVLCFLWCAFDKREKLDG